MSTKRSVWLSSMVLLLSLTACSPEVTSISESLDNPSASSDPATAGEMLAASVARALASSEVRASAFKAWRHSRITAHRLRLADFLASPEGRSMLAALATQWGMDEQSASERIRNYGDLDFYLPVAIHRRTWTGSDQFAVMMADRDARGNARRAWNPEGRPIHYGTSIPRSMMDSRPALVLLAPARPSGLRVDPQPDNDGLVIQDPQDGQLSGSYRFYAMDGTAKSLPLTKLMGRRAYGAGGGSATTDDESGCTGVELMSCDVSGGQTPPIPDTTYLQRMIVRNVCDFNNCDTEGNEFRFFVTLRNSTGVQLATGDMSIYDTPTDYDWGRMPLVLFKIKSSDQHLEVAVREDDGGWGMDNFGDLVLTSSSNVYNTALTSSNGFGGGDYTCDYVGYRSGPCANPNVPPVRQVRTWYSWTP